ncbi:hypothetical protein BCR41DRAFT_345660 [Lobosporangium transversale]|uniref:Uncharacterized protein n=1 Tax=Lobosporangium transversale TaxID=64571 RepID=A0A1Y2GZC6_9FUNG|nr:hypothetical protein BCR41DRAFT_345660 [Lobosporangium transversale]ORZ27657.1 hypothetical protein BCR41DRAFT_345660 [Lobosporangium transversale]|eukprot:XP_021885360.1 hypothetical protein BCR41DRAFT_345660 [Lobosporangium transversale]
MFNSYNINITPNLLQYSLRTQQEQATIRGNHSGTEKTNLLKTILTSSKRRNKKSYSVTCFQ